MKMKKRIRIISIAMLICFLNQLLFPITAYALTGGPSQPEVESFEPVGTSEMVDLFSGDFNYNIPLMDVDGYPINIAYHSGVTMDQEASWVGLGWNLNPGVIGRNMRGIPDDFSGDVVDKFQHVKTDYTYGVTLGVGIELFGGVKNDSKYKKFIQKLGVKSTLGINVGINYNNYRGLGIESTITPALSSSQAAKTTQLQKMGFTASLDIASSSKDGFSIRPKLGMNRAFGNSGFSNNTSVGMSVSSRGGVKSLTIQSGISASFKHMVKDQNKKDKLQLSTGSEIANGGSTISFGTQTYTPAIGMAFNNLNVSFSASYGSEVKGINAAPNISGYFSSQELAGSHSVRGAYGVLYAENYPDNDAMLDFNREKDGSYSAENPILPIPVFTYDLFTASGQGVGGMYKPFRSDVPVVHDPNMSNTSIGGSLGGDVAVGDLFKGGLNPAANYTDVRAGSWEQDNDLLRRFHFTHKTTNDPYYEPVYFKNTGEKNAVDGNTISYMDLDYPLRPSLGEIAPGLGMKDVFLKSDKLEKNVQGTHSEIDILTTPAIRTKRDKRNQLFSYLTVEDADYCLLKDLGYQYNTATDAFNYDLPTIPRADDWRKPKHITEITITNDQGSRYVYGIPAYNKVQYDISFTNANDPDDPSPAVPFAPDLATGQVNYDPALDFTNYANLESRKETRRYLGNDHALNVTKTPAYAHSYLLTAVLSPDYIDNDAQPGPSPDDYGNYTKLSYRKVSDNYKWRVPYNNNRANYSEGLKSDNTDDNASIMYGVKEVWLVATIAGKHHFAKFYISPREDGFGVAGINGGRGTGADDVSYKLDSIGLFSYLDSNTPIKMVHFEYNYELCPKVDNNSVTNHGKLTLKRLYFTYGNSRKGKFNSYVFEYAKGLLTTHNPDYNPEYNIKSYDRWGNFKKHDVSTVGKNAVDFPYTDQNKAVTDINTQAWSLTTISLPSGGEININYESDDYAYVQNRRAMQMVKIKGFGNYSSGEVLPLLGGGTVTMPNLLNPNLSESGVVMGDKLYQDERPKDCIFFDLSPDLINTDAALLKQYLLEGTGNILYYNCLVNLLSTSIINPASGDYEYIRGYTEVWDAGVINMGGTHPVGWIRVKLKDDNETHPISLSAWQYARMYLPHLVYPGSNLRKKGESGDVTEAIVRGLLGFIFDAADMIEGVNDKLRDDNKGNNVKLPQSWIRINNLTGAKLGGGCRVKKIEISDKWGTLSQSEASSSYGQEYAYTTSEYYNGKVSVISSGVASYEPSIGNDENPFKMPVSYTNENIGVPDDEFYSEEPFGEAYFPAAQVGYSRVTVKNIVPSTVTNHGTGKVVHEFYTAREFPVFTSRTDIASKQQKSSAIFSLTGFSGEEHNTMVQGYQIELNDMHGKPKAVYNYAQANIDSDKIEDAFSGVKYDYAVEDPTSPVKRLSNDMQVIDDQNHISTQKVGLEVEMMMDTRKHKSEAVSGGLALNLDLTLLIVPVPVFSVWPNYSSEITSFKSAVMMRVINRYGLVKKTTAFEEGSSIITENILLDAETGETLLTKTNNEYDDDIYNTKVPAHWVYEGMGQAYKNWNVVFDIRREDAGEHPLKAYVNGVYKELKEYLTEGDEVSVTSSSGEAYCGRKYWIREYAGSLYFVASDGSLMLLPLSQTYTVKVLRSGRKNLQNIPVMQVTSMATPQVSTGLVFNENTKVLNASAVSFNETWRIKTRTKNDCDYHNRHEDLVNIFSFLVSTGQLGLGDIGTDHDKEMNLELPGAFAFLDSYIRKLDEDATSFTTHMPVGLVGGDLRQWGYFFPGAASFFSIKIPPSYTPVSLQYLSSTDASFGRALLTYRENGILKTLEIEFITEFSSTGLEEICNCDENVNLRVNPFYKGIKGNWRTQKEWVYYDSRTPNSIASSATTNIRIDGAYSTFGSFWAAPTTSTSKWTEATHGKWTETNEVTKYNSTGIPIESKDALGRYSAAVFGYFDMLPMAVATNAKYTQIGYDGREETFTEHDCHMKNLDFSIERQNLQADQGESHTGWRSYHVFNNGNVFATAPVKKGTEGTDNGNMVYNLNQNNFNGWLEPEAGTYIIGAWIKVGRDKKRTTYANTALPDKSGRIEIEINRGSAGIHTERALPKGPIIEGWQRIETILTIVSTDNAIRIKLVGADEGTLMDPVDTWFDDIRFHPYDAKFKSFVYDIYSHRLTAELDENNYATFYEYNTQGQLVRVKKETEKGIVTLKEMRGHQHKRTP